VRWVKIDQDRVQWLTLILAAWEFGLCYQSVCYYIFHFFLLVCHMHAFHFSSVMYSYRHHHISPLSFFFSSWSNGTLHHSSFKFQIVPLSLLCAMFLSQLFFFGRESIEFIPGIVSTHF